jgi:hypothetical protein
MQNQNSEKIPEGNNRTSANIEQQMHPLLMPSLVCNIEFST